MRPEIVWRSKNEDKMCKMKSNIDLIYLTHFLFLTISTICVFNRETFTHPQANQDVDKFIFSSDLEKCFNPSLSQQ